MTQEDNLCKIAGAPFRAGTRKTTRLITTPNGLCPVQYQGTLRRLSGLPVKGPPQPEEHHHNE